MNIYDLLLTLVSFIYQKKVWTTGMDSVTKYKVFRFTVLKKIQTNTYTRKYYFKVLRSTKHYKQLNENLEISPRHFDVVDMAMVLDKPLLVSVIVPNYNHAPYLKERLDSIYRQTYQNIEVILLDDSSSDNSVEILEQYVRKYPHNTRLIVNEHNSGKVFRQWNKGLELAKGDLIWIAESDDYCDTNFLEEVIKAFAHQSVMLSYAHSDFMQDGKKIWTLKQYLHDLPVAFDSPFITPAHTIVNTAFAIKNIIPNVSSAVFRNVGTIPDDVASLFESMSLCGDWLFYLWLIKGGTISYTNKINNYYRIHPQSTSLRIQKTLDYYIETYKVSEYIVHNYAVDLSVFKSVENNLIQHSKEHGCISEEEVKKVYDISKLEECASTRNLNVLVCGYDMMQGGGEIFPIYLANELKNQGISVTFIDFRLGKHDEEIRKKLNKNIPLIELTDVRYLKKAIPLLGADIVHTHEGSTDKAVAHVIQNKEKKCKHIITLHGMYEAIPKEDLNDILDKVLQSCSCFVYIADKNLLPFKEITCPIKFSKISNGLPIIPIHPHSRLDLGIEKEDFCVTLVSRSMFYKGWPEAIEAVKIANSRSSRWIHLLLIGDGECYESLKDTELPSYIHLLGRKGDVRNYFAMSDLGLLPSKFKGESFPLVLIESFMSGTPVVASNIGEIRNMVTAENGEMAGVLFDLVDWEIPVEELAQILVQLSTEKETYQRIKNAVNCVKNKFDITNTAQQYIGIYKEALRNH